MPLAARRGVDTAAGVHISGPNTFVTIGGAYWVTIGEINAAHGILPHLPGPDAMAQGSSFVTINGIPVCVAGHAAGCGCATSGSGHLETTG